MGRPAGWQAGREEIFISGCVYRESQESQFLKSIAHVYLNPQQMAPWIDEAHCHPVILRSCPVASARIGAHLEASGPGLWAGIG